MRGRAVPNRRSPTATMKNPSTARGIILKYCVAVIAITQGKYRSGPFTRIKTAVQPVQGVLRSKRLSSHAIGRTMTEMNGTSKNRFANMDRAPFLI
jgi:hypothetical protein